MANLLLKDAEGIEREYPGVTCINFKTVEGGMATFVEDRINYVKGDPVEIELKAENWNGTSYTITTSEYGAISENIQVGVPPTSSAKNARLVVQSAITIPSVTNSYTTSNSVQTYSSSTIILVAVTAPVEDITIALWGLI